VNILLIFLILTPGSRLSTSFYTFHKLGDYSISDLYLNYALRRYDIRLTLEKRTNDFGPKSFSVSIDSLLTHYQLTVGERPYYVNSPLSTILNVWGLTVTGRDGDIFLGKTRDMTTALPPTFSDNKHTVGATLRRHLWYRIPLEFFLIRKSDNTARDGITQNNSFGTNAKVKVGDNMSFQSQFWANFSNEGPGGCVALSGKYTGQQYGGHAYFRKISRNYVTPGNLKALGGSRVRFDLYQKPVDWLQFEQDIAYSSYRDFYIGWNTAVSKYPYPETRYGINYSRKNNVATQHIQAKWRHRRIGIGTEYTWSSERQVYRLKLEEEISSVRLWQNVQLFDGTLFQLGGIFTVSPTIKFRNFLNLVWENSHSRQSAGAEVSFRTMQTFSVNCTYEHLRQNGVSDHFISLNLSNTMRFDEIGFSSVYGRVYMDINNNGMYDVEDQAVPDVEVMLDNKKTAMTTHNGSYSFSFVKAGAHNVNLNLGSIPAEIGTEKNTIMVTTGLFSKEQVDFSLEELGMIEGLVFYDENKNGTHDTGEAGVPNAVLALNGYLTTTGQNGRYRFANLVPGTYVLEPRVLPQKTMLSATIPYVYVVPGMSVSDYNLGIVEEERPVKRKVFGDTQND
jgi:hypothetical protein